MNWIARKSTEYICQHEIVEVHDDGRIPIAIVFGGDNEPNVPLICAARDLLALAKQYASECSECGGHGLRRRLDTDGTLIDDVECDDCADIRAAIAKAEGRS